MVGLSIRFVMWLIGYVLPYFTLGLIKFRTLSNQYVFDMSIKQYILLLTNKCS